MQTYKTRTEQNNDHMGIIHKIQFRSSFKSNKKVKKWLLSNIAGENFRRVKVAKCSPGDE